MKSNCSNLAFICIAGKTGDPWMTVVFKNPYKRFQVDVLVKYVVCYKLTIKTKAFECYAK